MNDLRVIILLGISSLCQEAKVECSGQIYMCTCESERTDEMPHCAVVSHQVVMILQI